LNLARDRFTEDLRRNAFSPGADDAPPRIGAEVELLCMAREGGGVAHAGTMLVPWLRRHAAARGWVEGSTGKGAPRFVTPGGGAVTFEPGGQIEYASRPHPHTGALIRELREALAGLRDSAEQAGIMLVAAGIDPENPLEASPLQFGAPRYEAMDHYFAAIGPYGARMMRQTAAVQVAVDWCREPGLAALQWRTLNAAAPALTAFFAASPRYEGRDTGHASFRAHCWRRLDPARTGIFQAAGDPVREYADFALHAPAMLEPAADGVHLPFGALLSSGTATPENIEAHLSTLFPDVRPRGYLEVRCMDAVPVEALAAPVLMVAGIAADERALKEAAEAVGAPDVALLTAGGRHGLADARLARHAADLLTVARRAWARLPGRFDAADAEAAAEWMLSRVACSAARKPLHR
jgi:glutamate--cysteine ligase